LRGRVNARAATHRGHVWNARDEESGRIFNVVLGNVFMGFPRAMMRTTRDNAYGLHKKKTEYEGKTAFIITRQYDFTHFVRKIVG